MVSVDDCCLRRGRTYGAILVDLERQRVIDLLPDRAADTFAAWLSPPGFRRLAFAAWLENQPPIRVVSRDRGATFADGATRGAPQAIHVADRFHLLKNLEEPGGSTAAGAGA